MKKLLFIPILFFSLSCFSQQSVVDSLKKRLEFESNDSIIVNLLNAIASQYVNSNPEEVRKYGEQALDLADKINYPRAKVRSYFNIGNSHYIGGDFPKSIDNYLKALEILEELDDKQGIANALMGIGNVQSIQGNHDKAIEYQERAMAIREEIGDSLGLAGSYNNLGSIYTDQGEYIKALEYHFKSMKIKEKMGQWKGLSSSYGNIGGIYQAMGNYPKAMEFQLKAFEIREKLNNTKGMVMSYTDIGKIHFAQKQYKQALEYQNRALQLATQMGFGDGIKNALNALSETHGAMGNTKASYSYYKRYVIVKDSIYTLDKSAEIAELEALFQKEKDTKKIELLEKDKQIRELQIQENEERIARQRLYMLLGIISLVLALGFIYFLFKRNQYKQRLNENLESRNKRIIEQKEIIEDKNQQLTSSMNYAGRIQEGMLPEDDIFKRSFSDFFTLTIPRDIVSGDFYWCYQNGSATFLACADCTGHGVPGSLLSMLGQNMLTQIVIEKQITDPGEILSELNRRIIDNLKRKAGAELNEGMDISFVKWNKTEQKMQFAGAMNSLLYVDNNEVFEVSAERVSIGGFTPIDHRFSTIEVQVIETAGYYLYTDGYQDQFGGKTGKKLKASNFKKVLLEMQKLSMDEQKENAQKFLKDWMGDYDQVDDICLIGFKI